MLQLTVRREDANAAYRVAARLLKDGPTPLAELSALEVVETAPTQPPTEEAFATHIREGDRWRDARDYARAAEAYGAAVALAPTRVDIGVQHANMLKDGGRVGEAEAAYRSALARLPDHADIHLQLGHALKLQGRRAAALECYRRAAELAPLALAPKRELSAEGEPASQEQLFGAQLRLGGVEALMEMTGRLAELRAALDRIAATLPDIQAQLAFPVACYDRFRELYSVPDQLPVSTPRSFANVLLADREGLETLRAQIAAIMGQTHRDW